MSSSVQQDSQVPLGQPINGNPSQPIQASLSIVMPVYNEQGSIEKVVNDFASILTHFNRPEFVIVDDASKDSTLQILHSLQKRHPFLRVISQVKNSGHGPALMRAFREASGDFIFHCDSDNQFYAGDFWLLWNKMRSENCDLVLGHRRERHDPFARLVLTRIVRFFILLWSRIWMPDSNCPFRLYRRSALDIILDSIPDQPLIPSILMAVAAYRFRMQVRWLPVRHLPRLTDHSFIRSWKIFTLCFPAVKEIFNFEHRLRNAKIPVS